MPLFSIDTHGQLDPHRWQEWLLTNGLGGFASSTVIGCNTRRYHGVLCAATLPPLGRVMTVNRIGEMLFLDGNASRSLEFSVNQFRECFHPRGDQYLRRFTLDDTARWEYDVEGVGVVKEMQLCWMKNVAGVRYTVDPGARRRVKLALLPFMSVRDFHHENRADGTHYDVRSTERAVAVHRSGTSLAAHLAADAGRFEPASDWWYSHYYAIEAERGSDCLEDLYTPGRFAVEAEGRVTLTLWVGIEPQGALNWDDELRQRREKIAKLAAPAGVITSRGDPGPLSPERATASQKKLARAANDFVVYRRAPNGSDGSTIIAGYPWFSDWGRDTMISLPGLLLSTGRFQQAQQVLCVFAEYVNEGMIPNVFDDYNNEPHYNTVDASLWFIHAAFEYLRLSHDGPTFETRLLPACQAILKGYRQGTRFGICMDAADGLINQGDQNTQLTWMDAKTNGVAFTPRQGKAVEINALWYHALVLLHQVDLAAKVRENFQKRFWVSPARGLADVVHGEWRDESIRPNQIFAVSLPNSPLTDQQQASVVDVVRRELLTPMGLRTLARSDKGYRGIYMGTAWDRDGAYHNGTVWPWLIGPFLSAYLRVNGSSQEAVEQATRWLRPLVDQMQTGSIGQIPEIADGDPPHAWRGTPAQAWSVAEALRLTLELGM